MNWKWWFSLKQVDSYFKKKNLKLIDSTFGRWFWIKCLCIRSAHIRKKLSVIYMQFVSLFFCIEIMHSFGKWLLQTKNNNLKRIIIKETNEESWFNIDQSRYYKTYFECGNVPENYRSKEEWISECFGYNSFFAC